MIFDKLNGNKEAEHVTNVKIERVDYSEKETKIDGCQMSVFW